MGLPDEDHWLGVYGRDVTSGDVFEARFGEHEIAACLGLSSDDGVQQVAAALADTLKPVARTLVIRAAPPLLECDASIGKKKKEKKHITVRAGASDEDWLRISATNPDDELWSARFSRAEVASALGDPSVQRSVETAEKVVGILRLVSRTLVLRA